MSAQLTDTGNVLESIRRLTEKAARQAKIEHVDGLLDTLALREQALAELYGFNPEHGLPAATRDETQIPLWACPDEFKDLAAQIRDLDRQLNEILKHNLEKIRGQKQLLNDGEKFLHGVQTLYRGTSESRYLDHVG